MSDYRYSDALRGQIQTRLAGFETQDVPSDGLRRAAVAIVIAQDEASDQASVLLTMRPAKLNRHGGQYALPGGRLDAGETEIQAARRELHEELGLDLGEDAVMGRLDHFTTHSGFRMEPVILWAEGPITLRPDPTEVEAAFHLPFHELDSPDIPALLDSDGEHPILSAFFPRLGHTVYAPTAAILYQFREIALRGQTTRAAHFEHPMFARR